ncbi:hypothetical protein [Streptosporangium jomthongense]|uniref:Uncharacterized protein n=1 Tax=Streptosporangium jomthongense TaxID=1193683 RepID=A0ABV8F9C5_9ACTN
MKRITVGLLSAALGGSLLLSASPASAQRASLSVHIDSVNPNPVVVTEDRDTNVTVEVRTTEAIRVELRLRPAVNTLAAQEAPEAKLFHDGDLWRFSTRFDSDDFEGRWLAIADAYDRDGKKLTDQVNFSVKHEQAAKTETRVGSFRVSPTSVRKGRSVYFTGRLEVRNHRYWAGARGEEVGIYFRSRGSSAWKWVASADTGWRGQFRTKARASRSGEYRAVFEGTDRLEDSSSRSIRVRVWGGGWHR